MFPYGNVLKLKTVPFGNLLLELPLYKRDHALIRPIKAPSIPTPEFLISGLFLSLHLFPVKRTVCVARYDRKVICIPNMAELAQFNSSPVAPWGISHNGNMLYIAHPGTNRCVLTDFDAIIIIERYSGEIALDSPYMTDNIKPLLVHEPIYNKIELYKENNLHDMSNYTDRRNERRAIPDAPTPYPSDELTPNLCDIQDAIDLTMPMLL